MDVAGLRKKVAAARLSWVEYEGLRFQIRRPGQLDFLRLAGRGIQSGIGLESSLDAVRDWQGVTARHFGEDSDEPVPFDALLLEDLVNDRGELITFLAGAVSELMSAAEATEAAKKP